MNLYNRATTCFTGQHVNVYKWKCLFYQLRDGVQFFTWMLNRDFVCFGTCNHERSFCRFVFASLSYIRVIPWVFSHKHSCFSHGNIHLFYCRFSPLQMHSAALLIHSVDFCLFLLIFFLSQLLMKSVQPYSVVFFCQVADQSFCNIWTMQSTFQQSTICQVPLTGVELGCKEGKMKQ